MGVSKGGVRCAFGCCAVLQKRHDDEIRRLREENANLFDRNRSLNCMLKECRLRLSNISTAKVEGIAKLELLESVASLIASDFVQMPLEREWDCDLIDLAKFRNEIWLEAQMAGGRQSFLEFLERFIRACQTRFDIPHVDIHQESETVARLKAQCLSAILTLITSKFRNPNGLMLARAAFSLNAGYETVDYVNALNPGGVDAPALKKIRESSTKQAIATHSLDFKGNLEMTFDNATPNGYTYGTSESSSGGSTDITIFTNVFAIFNLKDKFQLSPESSHLYWTPRETCPTSIFFFNNSTILDINKDENGAQHCLDLSILTEEVSRFRGDILRETTEDGAFGALIAMMASKSWSASARASSDASEKKPVYVMDNICTVKACKTAHNRLCYKCRECGARLPRKWKCISGTKYRQIPPHEVKDKTFFHVSKVDETSGMPHLVHRLASGMVLMEPQAAAEHEDRSTMSDPSLLLGIAQSEFFVAVCPPIHVNPDSLMNTSFVYEELARKASLAGAPGVTRA